MNYINDTIKFDKKSTKIVAHRGFRKVEVENTVKAFNYAAKSTAYGIENDVHLTKDNKFVVIHDDNLVRLAGIDNGLNVEDMTFDELRAISLLGKDGTPDSSYQIPTVEEYLAACKQGDKQAVLEIKHIDYENSKILAKMVYDFGYLDKTTFISFQQESLKAVRDLYPNASVQFLTNEFDIDLIPLLVKNKWDLDIGYPALTKERLDALHELGITVNVWTVNDKDVAELLAFWGVDMITSDCLE